MKDPTRWIDDPSAPKGAAALLGQAKRAPSPSAAARARMGARVAASASAAGKFAGLGARWWIFGGTVGLAAMLLGLAGARTLSHDSISRVARVAPVPLPSPEIRTSESPPATTIASISEVATRQAAAAPAPATLPPAPEAPQRTVHAVVATHADATTTEREEALLLEHARAALQSDPAGALEGVREHLARFPHGQLSEEREYIAIRALARLGRTADARARATAFLRRYPNGIYSSPVQRVMEQLR